MPLDREEALAAEILTPSAPATPRINGPTIYGQRPGRPFLYHVPVTGEAPITLAADGLPAGLSLDAKTGNISGKVAQAGEFQTTLHATNSKGSADKKFKIVIGDEVALTPPMGWNSWNCWAGAVDQDKVLRSARAMATSGLIDHGWTYVNIDDTWQGKRDASTKALQGNEKFPDMKAMCDEIHGLGLKAGIYSTPWITSYATHPGGSSDDPDGKWSKPTIEKKNNVNKKIKPWAVGTYHFMQQDAKQFADWGFDYLKYDWNPIEEPDVKEMHDALLASGRDIVYSLSNNLAFENGAMAARLANAWRDTGDIRDRWDSVASIANKQPRWTKLTGPGHYNDPDMLVVGMVGWGPKLHPSNLTPDEQFTHISLWCLLSAPLLIGCDLEKLDDFTLSLLTNDEVLAIDQDARATSAKLVSEQGEKVSIKRPDKPDDKCFSMPSGQVWAKTLEDGSTAVGLFNFGNEPMKVAAEFKDVGVTGKQTARDLWPQKDLGEINGKFEATIPPHGCRLIKLAPVK
jgi:alpha-galactosidase